MHLDTSVASLTISALMGKNRLTRDDRQGSHFQFNHQEGNEQDDSYD